LGSTIDIIIENLTNKYKSIVWMVLYKYKNELIPFTITIFLVSSESDISNKLDFPNAFTNGVLQKERL